MRSPSYRSGIAGCVPPWSDSDLRIKIRGAQTYGTEPIGGRLNKVRAPVRSIRLAHSRDTLARNADPAEPHLGTAVGEFPHSDTGNAEYFAGRCGDRIRFDHRRQLWLVWDDHRWKPDATGGVYRLVKESVRARGREAADYSDTSQRTAGIKYALASENRPKLEACLALARNEYPLADDGERWDEHSWLVGCPNGVLDLRTGELRDGRPDDRITMCTGTPFVPDAKATRWERFMREIFQDDSELVSFVHRAVGYSLTGETSDQSFFMAYGSGSNGKSTFQRMVSVAFGDYAANTPFSTLEMSRQASIPNDVAALVNRRFVTASETNESTRLNEARLKSLSGCDPMSARFMRGEWFTFTPVLKLWVSVNHRPTVRDDSHGFWRRVRLIPFERQFSKDDTLVPTLTQELPGILAWVVRGALAWQREGLAPPRAVAAATQDYQEDSDVLQEFLDAACVLGPAATHTVGSTPLHKAYLSWAERERLSGRDKLNRNDFYARIKKRFGGPAHDKTGNSYSGLRLRDDLFDMAGR